MRTLVAAAVATMTLAMPGAAQIRSETFQVRNTADLAAICSVPPSDPNYGEAMGFCRGFARGAGEYHREITRPNAPRLYCLPQQMPPDAELRQRFVTWVNADPRNAQQRPAEGLFRFLSVTFPCPR